VNPYEYRRLRFNGPVPEYRLAHLDKLGWTLTLAEPPRNGIYIYYFRRARMAVKCT
jgi:hypothetical protein